MGYIGITSGLYEDYIHVYRVNKAWIGFQKIWDITFTTEN